MYDKLLKPRQLFRIIILPITPNIPRDLPLLRFRLKFLRISHRDTKNKDIPVTQLSVLKGPHTYMTIHVTLNFQFFFFCFHVPCLLLSLCSFIFGLTPLAGCTSDVGIAFDLCFFHLRLFFQETK